MITWYMDDDSLCERIQVLNEHLLLYSGDGWSGVAHEAIWLRATQLGGHVPPVPPRFLHLCCVHVPYLYIPECMCICYSLGSNSISDEGARAVADSMKYCTSLKTLE